MIRHMLLFSFRDGVGTDARERLLDELSTFPNFFPAMRGFSLGANISRRDRTFQFGMTVAFDDVPALDAYLDSAQHERFVAARFRPLISDRAIVSFEYDAAP